MIALPGIARAIPWRLVAVLAAVAGIVAAVLLGLGAVKRAGMLEAQRDTARAVAAANAQLAEVVIARNARLEDIVAANARDKAALRRAADTRRKGILHAPPEDDGPVAPVLRRALDGLQPGPNAGAGDSTARADGS